MSPTRRQILAGLFGGAVAAIAPVQEIAAVVPAVEAPATSGRPWEVIVCAFESGGERREINATLMLTGDSAGPGGRGGWLDWYHKVPSGQFIGETEICDRDEALTFPEFLERLAVASERDKVLRREYRAFQEEDMAQWVR